MREVAHAPDLSWSGVAHLCSESLEHVELDVELPLNFLQPGLQHWLDCQNWKILWLWLHQPWIYHPHSVTVTPMSGATDSRVGPTLTFSSITRSCLFPLTRLHSSRFFTIHSLATLRSGPSLTPLNMQLKFTIYSLVCS